MSGAPGVPPGTTRSLARRLGRIAFEGAAAIGLSLGFFSGFLVLLTVVFPSGQSLRSLLATSRLNADARPGSGDRAGATLVSHGMEREGPLASLQVLRAAVRRREAGTIAWTTAHSGQRLFERDGVQTETDGRALVQFDASILRLEGQSLVILGAQRADEHADEASQNRKVAVRGFTLLEGEVFAKVDSGNGPFTISVNQALATAGDTGPAEVRVAARPGRPASITVLEGEIALEGGGHQVQIGRRQFARVAEDGTPTQPLPIPEAPTLQEPADEARFDYLDLPPRVPFHWNSAGGITRWRVRVARDPELRDLVVNETTSTPALEWGRLEPGRYFWQAAAIASDVEGVGSEVRRLEVRRANAPLALHVNPLPSRVEGLSCQVEGRIAGQATVYVNGRAVAVGPDGRFRIEAQLKPGANIVLVEAVDLAGQSTYASHVVHAKP